MRKINKKHIISKDKNTGETVSLYEDDMWDLSMNRPKTRGSCKMFFKTWCESDEKHEVVVNEMKYLTYLLLTEVTTGRRSILSITSICGNYQVLIKRLAVHAVARNITISDLLQSVVEIKDFTQLKKHKTSLEPFSSLLLKLIKMGEDKTGMHIMNGVHIAEIRRKGNKNRPPVKSQAEFIPQRLLTEFIDHWQAVMQEFESHWNSIYGFINHCLDNPGSGTSKSTQISQYGVISTSIELNFKELSDSFHLTEYFERYGLYNIKKVAGHISFVQCVGKYLIHIYSGMRFDEAMALKTDSLIKENTEYNLQRWVLKAETTKYSGNSRRTFWVTSREIGTAWKVLTTISDYIGSKIGAKKDQPVFIAATYLGLGCEKKIFNGQPKCSSSMTEKNALKYIGDCANITKEDVKVLRNIDPMRDWSNSEFTVGEKWTLRTHQCRRTIAILAAQSGLVSIPSLKRQLQHLTEEMSFYYSNGSTAVSEMDVERQNEFSELLKNSSAEAMAYAYIVDYLLTADVFLSESTIGKNERPNKKVTAIKFLTENRDKYIKKFESGLMSYKETVLGACEKNGPCLHRAHRSLTACLPCPSAQIKLPKLNRAISIQEKFLETLDPNKVEWIVAGRDLDDLKKYKNKWS